MLTYTAPVRWFTNNLEYWKWNVIASDTSTNGRTVQVIESPLNPNPLLLDDDEYQRDPSGSQEKMRIWGIACAQERALRDKDPLRGLPRPLAWLREQKAEQSRNVPESADWYRAAAGIGLHIEDVVIRRSPDRLRTHLKNKSGAVLEIQRFECERMHPEVQEVETMYFADWILFLSFNGPDSRYNSALVRVTKGSYSQLVQNIVDAAQMVRKGSGSTVEFSRDFGPNVRSVLSAGRHYVEVGANSPSGYRWSDRLSPQAAEALALEISGLPETVRSLLEELSSSPVTEELSSRSVTEDRG